MKSPETTVVRSFKNGAYIDNFRVTGKGTLIKREGSAVLCQFPYRVRGALSVRENDGDVIYAVAGSYLFRYESGEPTIIGLLDGAVFADAAERAELFFFAGALYVLGGGDYFRYDGSTLERVEGYVPLIRRYASATDGGREYERQNLLTNRVRMRLCPDSSSTQFRLWGNVASVEAVYLRGNLMNTANYTVSITNGTAYVKFGSTYIGYGDDGLEVWYTLAGESRRGEITSCRHAAVYGGDTDTRVFLYGGGRPAVIFPTDTTDADATPQISGEYFPVGGEITVGDGNLYVSGAVRQFDRLAIFTEDGAFYTYPKEGTTEEGLTRYSFPILPLNSDVGASRNGGAVLVENEPYALNENGLFRFKSTTVRDERLAVLVEAPDFAGLTRDFIDGCSLYVNRLRGELWCIGDGSPGNTHVAVYNARLDVWYRFSGFRPDFMFTYASDAAYAAGEFIYRFADGLLTDNGVGFDAIYESGPMEVGSPFERKTLYEFGIAVSRVADAKLGVMLGSDSGEELALTFEVPDGAAGCPAVMRSHARISRAAYLGYRILLAAGSPPADVHAVMLRARSI